MSHARRNHYDHYKELNMLIFCRRRDNCLKPAVLWYHLLVLTWPVTTTHIGNCSNQRNATKHAQALRDANQQVRVHIPISPPAQWKSSLRVWKNCKRLEGRRQMVKPSIDSSARCVFCRLLVLHLVLTTTLMGPMQIIKECVQIWVMWMQSFWCITWSPLPTSHCSCSCGEEFVACTLSISLCLFLCF